MKKAPKIAVIVLCWNRKNETLECLESIHRADYPNFEVILVDNASTDGTVESVQTAFARVRILRNRQNLGYAGGNNVGIRNALSEGADFVLVLNNDTVIDPALFRCLVEAADRFPEAGIFSPTIYQQESPHLVYFAGTRWEPSQGRFSHRFKNEPLGQQTFEATDYADGSAIFFRKEVPLKAGLFDERFFLYWEEVEWCYRARRHGFGVMTVPEAKVWHKGKASLAPSEKDAVYAYYSYRNKLLWMERCITGKGRWHGFMRCLKACYWGLLRLKSADVEAGERKIIRAKLRGVLDYFRRRFGEAEFPTVRAEN